MYALILALISATAPGSDARLAPLFPFTDVVVGLLWAPICLFAILLALQSLATGLRAILLDSRASRAGWPMTTN